MNASRHVARTLIIATMALSPIALASAASALSFVQTQSAGEQSTSSIIGIKVQNSAGDKLGDVNYLVLDNSGKVSTVVIGVGGFLGVGEKNVGVAYNDLKFGADKDGKQIAVIDATKDSLTSAPNYVWTEKSAMDKMREDASALAEKAKKEASDLTVKAKDAAGIKNEPTTSQ